MARKSSRRNSTRAKWAVPALGIGYALVAVLLAVLAHAIVRDLTAAWTGVGLNPFSPVARATQSDLPLPPEAPTATAPIPEATPVPWDGNSRITILLLGLDFRDWQAGIGAPRSDTMMLLSVDPITQSVSILSVPRDLWVDIPGFTHNRINTAYSSGEANRLPGGGPALAMRTVESVIGVPIQYYAVVDFATFENLIDEVGGIDVLVPQAMRIAPIGRPSMALEAKAYHFDGAEALAYARNRRTGGGDFTRAERQQQVALAIRDRVIGFDMIPRLVARAPALYQQLASGVRTNLSLDQMIALAWMATRISKDNIQQAVIEPPSMVGFYTRPDGAQVLRPVTDEIRKLRDQLFVDTSGIVP